MLCLGAATPALAGFSDVPTTHWAYPAIKYVAVDHDYIKPYGEGFRPGNPVTRAQVARALALAFAPDAKPDPDIVVSDATGSTHAYAVISIQMHWFSAPNGIFNPDGHVDKATLDRALVLALGLTTVANSLGKTKTADGYVFPHAWAMRYMIIANELHLNYNYPTSLEKYEVLPTSSVSRSFTSWALWQAKTLSWWQLNQIQAYASITLPQMNAAEKKAVDFAFRYAGYPYVYAGEWYKPTSSGYCCGTQVQGGFDCSGFVWWMMKAPAGTWNNASIRGYSGWSLPQRGAADMARYAPTKISYAKLQPMDLLFWDTDDAGTGYQAVDHAGLYLGNDWMIHSSGSRGGASIDYIGDGSWWHDRFIWGRRLMPTYTPPPLPDPTPTPTPSPTTSPSP
jgi:cell wall-associated NlpC family hydrolase